MPMSLQFIEDEAFSGIPAKTVIIHNGLLYIGDCAFANANNLKDIYLPSTTQFIARSTLSSIMNVVIHGEVESYAQVWADEHGIKFIAENVWNNFCQGIRTFNNKNTKAIFISFLALTMQSVIMIGGCQNKDRSMRPQDRPELNPIDYRFP